MTGPLRPAEKLLAAAWNQFGHASPKLSPCVCGVGADTQKAAADAPHLISLELEMHICEEEPPPGNLCCAHFSPPSSLSSHICRLMRHTNTLPPPRLVSHRIPLRVRSNNCILLPAYTSAFTRTCNIESASARSRRTPSAHGCSADEM